MAKVVEKKVRKPRKDRDVCFTIMPFGGFFDDYYEHIYKPAIESCGLKAERADELLRPGAIIQDIWESTKKAKVILADLTNRNPNVFYELGLAHAIPKPVMLVTDNIDEVPFDLRSMRILEYNKDVYDWGVQLKSSIEIAIKEVLKSPNDAIPAAFVGIKKGESGLTVSPLEKQVIELRQELSQFRQQNSRNSALRRHSIDPVEARRLIHSYAKRGLSTMIIVDLLRRKGVPEEWTISQLRDDVKERR